MGRVALLTIVEAFLIGGAVSSRFFCSSRPLLE